jgi:hypothetical protein
MPEAAVATDDDVEPFRRFPWQPERPSVVKLNRITMIRIFRLRAANGIGYTKLSKDQVRNCGAGAWPTEFIGRPGTIPRTTSSAPRPRRRTTHRSASLLGPKTEAASGAGSLKSVIRLRCPGGHHAGTVCSSGSQTIDPDQGFPRGMDSLSETGRLRAPVTNGSPAGIYYGQPQRLHTQSARGLWQTLSCYATG